MRSQDGTSMQPLNDDCLHSWHVVWNGDLRVAFADCIVECKKVAETEEE